MPCVCPLVALRALVEAAKPGVSVLSLCEKGDAFIAAETSKVFKKEKEIKKGNVARTALGGKCVEIFRKVLTAVLLLMHQVSPSPPVCPSTTVCATSLL